MDENAKELVLTELVQGYDAVINSRVYQDLDYGDFMNYGYWEEHVHTHKDACENLMEELLSFIPHKRGRILDVACGKGASTRYLRKYYLSQNTTGINISAKQLEIAQKNAPDCSFALMDATDLKFESGVFDAVICVEAAFHFDTRERFFGEALRVLKPGGHLVLSDILMNREAEKRRKFRNEKNYVQDLREYRAIVEKTGFQDVAVVDATDQCWRGHFRRVVRYFHDRFFSRQIDRTELHAMLDNLYRLVPDIEFYILVKAVKA